MFEIDYRCLVTQKVQTRTYSTGDNTLKQSNRNWAVSHKYIYQSFMEGLFARTRGSEESIQTEEMKEKFEDVCSYVNETVSQSCVLEHIINSKYVEPRSLQHGSNKHSYTPNPDKLILYQNNSTKNRIKILNTSLKSLDSFEVELINPYGAYWGTITLVHNHVGSNYTISTRTNYLHFICKPKLIERSDNRDRYNLRTMKECQKVDDIEFIIDLKDIKEILWKMYLLNPIAVEIYTQDAYNSNYFFSFFTNHYREKFISLIEKYNPEVVQYNLRDVFENNKFRHQWRKHQIDTLDYLLLVNKYSSRSFNDLGQYPIMPWVGKCIHKQDDEISLNSDQNYLITNRDLSKHTGIFGSK